MQMPERKYEPANGYRYGFNGKEKDKDINSLTAYDYGFRIYNPAIGKFLSVDPLTKSYPELTPYQFASNTPIQAIDLDGLESKTVTNWVTINLDGSTTIRTLTQDHLKDGFEGPLGKGTLTKIHVDNRILVKNENYGKKGNTFAKMLNLPGKQEEYVIWEPLKRKRGGFYFVSKNGGEGQGPVGELEEKDLEPINIDLLVSAIGGANLMEPFSLGANNVERALEILDNISKSAEAGVTVSEIKEYLEKEKEEVKENETKKNGIVCPACSSVQDSLHIEDNNEKGTYSRLKQEKGEKEKKEVKKKEK